MTYSKLMPKNETYRPHATGVDVDWLEDAYCRNADPKIFFPDKGGDVSHAKDLCDRCPVVDECLDYAIENEEKFGTWGGMSPRERRRLRK